ncbi:enterochelin esterase [Prosthecobacter debontii]|uniref:Enterochelin esterase n=1 Tax=Prosthecobacter debontii TaxID=48467 RepID=A0A1T4XQQ1_9BACT|nr:alpha/beta hydrolase-fold protein [Prosthecobacter debontii]SKA91867.1 enterochelin esterase [Prosthecobacter debontii]
MPLPEIQEHVLTHASGTSTRKLWLLEPLTAKPERVTLFLDGEFYVNRMETPQRLMEWQQQGIIPPTAVLFISHVDGAARHRDLTCSADFAAFIAEDVVDWLRDRLPGAPASDWLMAGPSLGGLQAAFIALKYPEVFSRCLSQSGSFWWHEEWLTQQVSMLPARDSRFWISVGNQESTAGVSHPPTGLRQEVTQIEACERFAAALDRQDHHVHFQMYEGGHALEPWAAELSEALCWLLADD